MPPHSLPIGTHLTTPRFGYEHHGLYVGNGRVIHSPGLKAFLRRGRIEEVSLEEFSQGRRWRIRNRPRTRAEGMARVDRARARLGEDAYRFWSNNCEHFVQCIRGERRSRQVERFKVRLLGAIARLFGLTLAGCVTDLSSASAAGLSVKSGASVERWWTPVGEAAAVERRIALSQRCVPRNEPF